MVRAPGKLSCKPLWELPVSVRSHFMQIAHGEHLLDVPPRSVVAVRCKFMADVTSISTTRVIVEPWSLTLHAYGIFPGKREWHVEHTHTQKVPQNVNCHLRFGNIHFQIKIKKAPLYERRILNDEASSAVMQMEMERFDIRLMLNWNIRNTIMHVWFGLPFIL